VSDLLFGGGLCLPTAAISELVGLPLFATVTLVDFLSNDCIFAARLVHGGFLSASHTLTVLNESLSFCRLGTGTSH